MYIMWCDEVCTYPASCGAIKKKQPGQLMGALGESHPSGMLLRYGDAKSQGYRHTLAQVVGQNGKHPFGVACRTLFQCYHPGIPHSSPSYQGAQDGFYAEDPVRILYGAGRKKCGEFPATE